jgi:glycosyltransferase involved in cell wall biosynthesis
MSSSGHLVDVGIPAYCKPEYLEEAIESVLAQTLPSWRLLVSDDSPPDESVAPVVEPYLSDPRVEYVVSRTGDCARNWTRVIQTGSAPYVAILHDDDRWHPEFLERHVAFLEREPECGFVCSSARIIDGGGKVVGQSRLYLDEGVYPPEVIAPMLLRKNLVKVAAVLVRRSAYEAVGPEFMDTLTYPDWEMWLRLALKFPMGYLRRRDADYRVHALASTTVDHRDRETVLELHRHLDALVERELPGARLGPVERARRWARLSLSTDLPPGAPGGKLLARARYLNRNVRVRFRRVYR